MLLIRSVRMIDRSRHPQVVAQRMASDIMEEIEPAFPRDHTPLRQRTDMITTTSERGPMTEGTIARSSQAAGQAERPARRVRVPRPTRPSRKDTAAAGLSIRWGRSVVALIGALALVSALITLVLAPFTAVTWTLPVFSLLVGCGCLAALRYLAVTERSSRRRTPTSSSGVQPVSDDAAALPEAAAQTRSSCGEPFDLQQKPGERSSESESRRNRDRRADSGAEHSSSENQQIEDEEAMLDIKGLAVSEAVSRGHEQQLPAELIEGEQTSREEAREKLREQARRVAAGKPVAFSPVTTGWQPLAVPRPTYLDAPEARREPIEPVQPVQQASTSSTLEEAAQKGQEQARGFNLDDVLSRRRA